MRVLVYMMVGFLAFGCVDVNLKSDIGEAKYFDMDIDSNDFLECQKYSDVVGILNFTSAQIYDSRDIIKKSGINIEKLSTKWIISPKNALSNIVSKELLKSCIRGVNPPFSPQRVDKFLKVHILEIGDFISKDGDFARVAITYDIIEERTNKTLSNGFLKREIEIKDSSDEGIDRKSVV